MKCSTLTEGLMCCCKFTDDDNWYRVCVKSFVGDKKVFMCYMYVLLFVVSVYMRVPCGTKKRFIMSLSET